MDGLFRLSEEQLERIKTFFPKSRGVSRVDDRKVLSGIIYVQRHGLRWVDAPAAYGPYKTLYNRCRRWWEKGVFQLIFSELARSADTEPETGAGPEAGVDPEEVLMIDATYVKAHRTASSLKRGRCTALDRSHQRGPHQQSPHGLRRQRTACPHSSQRRAMQRLLRC